MAAARPSTSGVCDVRLIGCCCGSERHAIAATVVWNIRFPTHTETAHADGDDDAASHNHKHDEPNASGLEGIVIVTRRWRHIVTGRVTRGKVPSVTCCGRATRQAFSVAAFAVEAIPATRIESMTWTRCDEARSRCGLTRNTRWRHPCSRCKCHIRRTACRTCRHNLARSRLGCRRRHTTCSGARESR